MKTKHATFEQFKKKMTMFKCHVCGSTESREELVKDVFMVDGKPVLVENIPSVIVVNPVDLVQEIEK